MVWWYSKGVCAGRFDGELVGAQGLFFVVKPWVYGMRLDT